MYHLLAQVTNTDWVPIVTVIVVLVPFIVLPFALWLWMLCDCAANEPEGSSDKSTWLLVIILFGILGAIVYHSTRRKKRIQLYGK